jgi:hypothetical protein
VTVDYFEIDQAVTEDGIGMNQPVADAVA